MEGGEGKREGEREGEGEGKATINPADIRPVSVDAVD